MSQRLNLLMVVLVIGLLLAVGIPGLFHLRESARQSSCKNNLKQLGLSLHNVHDVSNSFPAGTTGNPDLPPERRWSCYPALFPYLAQAAAPPIDYQTDSRDPANWPLQFDVSKDESTFLITLHAPSVLTCPTAVPLFGPHQQVFADYVGITGVGPESPTVEVTHQQAGVWGCDRRTSLEDITAPQCNTILLLETARDRDVWFYGGRPTIRWVTEGEPPLGPTGDFGGVHAGGANCLLVDGSVRLLSNEIEPGVFLQMARIHPASELAH